MLPLISVIIPSYNNEKYITDTINSIIQQTYENLELIIIDDGSTDNSYNTIQNIINHNKRAFNNIIIEQHKNSGIVSTLNIALKHVQGEYIYFIASDDIAKPHAIQTLYDHIISGNYILAVGDNEIIDKNSIKISWDKERNILPYNDPNGFNTFWNFLKNKRKDINNIINNFGSYETLLKGNYIVNGILIKSSAMQQTGGYQTEAPLEDWYMNLQLSKLGKFIFVNDILFSYRWHDTNISHNSNKMEEYIKKTILYEKSIIDKSDSKYYSTLFNNYFYKKKILNLGIIKLIQQRDLFTKNFILQLANKKFILKRIKIM